MGYKRARVRFSSRDGFSMAEIMVGMFFITMAILLVGGLSQQVMQLAKKSSQTGTILEIRSMTNSITKNSDGWLNLMRSSTHTNGIYAGCIPDPKVNISTFSCPILDNSLLTSEPDLAAISNGQFHVVSAPIVSNSGEHIAGTIGAPVYLTTEGRACTDNDLSKCAFKSTGFFMRSNNKNNEDPGAIKFVIKIERNPLNVASGTTPMKPQFMSIDIGESWKDPTVMFGGLCPSGTVKIGYLSNGKPSCASTSKSCASSQLPIGVDEDGKPICKTLPNCTGSGGGVVLNPNGTDLMCSSASPCGANKLFLGYFAGSGEPMCSGSEVKCPAGEIQTGITITGGEMKAECESLPSCTDTNKRLAFNGTNFVCEAAAVPISCGADEVMTGIGESGQPVCIARAPASEDQSCPAGQEMYGIDSAGKIKCRPASGGSIPPAGGLECVTAAFNWQPTKTISVVDAGSSGISNWNAVFTEYSNANPPSATNNYLRQRAPYWGLTCNPGWQRTGCFTADGMGQSYQIDSIPVENGCATGAEEKAWNGMLYTTCCRGGGAGGGSAIQKYESPELTLDSVQAAKNNEFPNPTGKIPSYVIFMLIPKVNVAEYSAGEVVYMNHMTATYSYLNVTASTSKIFMHVQHSAPYVLTRNTYNYHYYLSEKNKWRLKYIIVY